MARPVHSDISHARLKACDAELLAKVARQSLLLPNDDDRTLFRLANRGIVSPEAVFQIRIRKQLRFRPRVATVRGMADHERPPAGFRVVVPCDNQLIPNVVL